MSVQGKDTSKSMKKRAKKARKQNARNMAKKQGIKKNRGQAIKKNRAVVVRTHTGKNKWMFRQWLHLGCMAKNKIIIILFIPHYFFFFPALFSLSFNIWAHSYFPSSLFFVVHSCPLH
jgi:hypothetical protein